MPKKFVWPILCMVLILLVSCDNNLGTIPEAQDIEEMNIPTFADFNLCKTVVLDKENLLLCYYQSIKPNSELASKIVCYNTIDNTYTEIYSGQLSNNSFYDVAFDCVDDGMNIYCKSYNSFYLKYDMNCNSVGKIALDYGGDFAVAISDTAYLVGDNDTITVYDLSRDKQKVSYDIDMGIVDYTLINNSCLAAIDGMGNIIILDCSSGSLEHHSIAEIPQGLVGYAGIKSVTDDNLIIAAPCEDSDVYQIFCPATDKVVAQHEARVCELAGIYEDTILFIECDDNGRKNSRLVIWNYNNTTKEVLFNVQEQYDDAYILDACLSDNRGTVFIVIIDNGRTKLLQYDLANSN